MIAEWSKPVERVSLTLRAKNLRTVGVLSPVASAGVSTFCRSLCEHRARAGSQTLLIDVNAVGVEPEHRSGAAPFAGEVLTDVRGYDIMVLRHDIDDWPRYANPEEGRAGLINLMHTYETIVLDLSPLNRTALITPAAIALACEAVLVVCPVGVYREQVEKSVSSLREDGVRIEGVVWIDVNGTSSSAQFGRRPRPETRGGPAALVEDLPSSPTRQRQIHAIVK